MSGMQCQSCAGRAQLYLCGTCQSKLRTTLDELPWWLEALSDAAVGHVRLGDSGGGRSTARREPFKGGDEALAKCMCGHPETSHDDYYVARDGSVRSVEQGCTAIDREVITTTTLQVEDDGQEIEVETAEEIETPCTCREYQPRTNQAKMRAQLLAAGRINVRAADLLDEIRNSMTTWVRHVAETRGIAFVRPGFIGPLLAGHVRMSAGTPALSAFLTMHVHTIACDEAAGECLADFTDHVGKIEKVINPPVPMRYLGPCRTFDEHTRKSCGTQLQCREGVLEVTCPKCRHTYNANHLQSLTENDLERERMTVDEILQYNKRLPEEYQINERTLRRWRKPGKHGEPPRLKHDGYLRPCSCGHGRADHASGCRKCGCAGYNGRVVINRHSDDDEPLYRWADIKRLRTEKPERKALAG